jgi:hypothetical protein
LQLGTQWYEPKDASALRQYTVELMKTNKLQYIKPKGGGCKDCGGVKQHTALLKKYKELFAADKHNEG